MKRKNRVEMSFVTRLKISWLFLTKKFGRHMQVMTCGNCESSDIVPLGEAEEITEIGMYTWKRCWKCEKCGAVCRETQNWTLSNQEKSK